MGSRTERFLENWVNESVRPGGASDLLAEAHRLAARCLEDAREQGISEDELLKTVGGELAGYIFCVMAEAAD